MKTVTGSGDLIDLEARSLAVLPILVIQVNQGDLNEQEGISFLKGFDSLDHLDFAEIKLADGAEVNLVQHRGAPQPGLLFCINPTSLDISGQISQVFQRLKLDTTVVSWVHPDYKELFDYALKKEFA